MAKPVITIRQDDNGAWYFSITCATPDVDIWYEVGDDGDVPDDNEIDDYYGGNNLETIIIDYDENDDPITVTGISLYSERNCVTVKAFAEVTIGSNSCISRIGINNQNVDGGTCPELEEDDEP